MKTYFAMNLMHEVTEECIQNMHTFEEWMIKHDLMSYHGYLVVEMMKNPSDLYKKAQYIDYATNSYYDLRERLEFEFRNSARSWNIYVVSLKHIK